MEEISVLIAECDRERHDRIRIAFSGAERPFNVIIAESPEAVFAAMPVHDFQAAFVDARSTGICGLELLRRIHLEDPKLPVVITAERSSEALAVAVFEWGASDFIIKSANYYELLPRAASSLIVNDGQISEQARRRPNDPNRIYDKILETAAELLDIHCSSIMILDAETGLLETKASRGLSRNYVTGFRPRPGEGVEGEAVTEGRPRRCGDLSLSPPPVFLEVAGREGLRSVLCVPFQIESRHAVINLYSHRADRFTETDERLASHLFNLSGLALETLNLYYRERHIAQTLQRSHFPDIDGRFDDWEIAHRYKVSMEEALLGGDFLDLFEVSNGRRAMVVADVSGKGIGAATQTAMIKYTLRSYALENPDPASVLKRTNDAFHALSRTDHFVTIFYGLIDSETGTLAYSSAGHPPPFFFSRHLNQVFNLEEVHLPIGIWGDEATFETTTLPFGPTDMLLVYTDGLTDCRHDGRLRGELFGQTNLENLFMECTGLSAEEAADTILNRVLKFSRGKMKDDVAFFVIRLLEHDRSRPRSDTSFSPAGRRALY